MSLLLASCATVKPVVRGPGDDAAQRGWALLDAGKRAEAVQAFESARGVPEALYGRALIAKETGDLDSAFLLFHELLLTARDEALSIAAIRQLASLAGEMPGEQRHEAQRKLAEVPTDKLSLDVRRRLYELRADHARRNGDETGARALEVQAGCPERWFIGGPYGHLPRLDLMREWAPDADAERDKLREVKPRACQVVLDGPQAHPGVLYAVTWIEAPRALEIEMAVETHTPYRVSIDDLWIGDNLDARHFPAELQRLRARLTAGWHRVVLKISGVGGRAEANVRINAEVPLRVFDGEAVHGPTRKGPYQTAQVVAPPVRVAGRGLPAELLELERALAEGDGAFGERASQEMIARHPKLAVGLVLSAQALQEDTSRPATFAQDRARRLLERALSLDPHLARARYMRAVMALGADRPREALAKLNDAPQGDPPYWRFAVARHQALKARGFNKEAEDALAEAARLHPEACPVIEALLTERRAKHDVKGARVLAERASRCSGGSDDLADHLRESADLPGAVAELRRLLSLDPMREGWRSSLAETLLQQGDAKSAVAEYGALISRFPRSTHYRVKMADAQVLAGNKKAARATLLGGLAEVPESNDLHRALDALCEDEAKGCGLLDDLRIDGKDVIAAYTRDPKSKSYSSPAVIVLDRTVTRVFPTGGRMTITHNIMQVLTKDGIDKWGEVQIPDGADVLTLRTVKADGSTREPEEISEKETVSVPDLEPGDYVEFEYVDPAAPPGAFDKGFIAERFYFRSFDAPLDRTEYLVVTPAGMKVAVDTRGDAPVMALSRKGNEELRTWADRRRPQAFAEPASTPMSENLPSVRVGSNISFDAWKDYLRETQFGVLRHNDELISLAQRLTKGARTPTEKLALLDPWVRRNIKAGGSLDEGATAILAKKSGSRVTLLAALLAASGVQSELWLARPASAALLDGPLPELEGFDQALLYLPELKRIVDPRYRHSPTGFVTPLLRGVSAIALRPGAFAPAKVEVDNPDDRHMDIEAELALDGSADVVVREKLRGWPAVEWREALEKLTPDRVRPEFEQRTLGFYFPGSTLKDLKWSGQDDDDAPFTVEYRFRSPQLARRVGGRLVLPAPYPAMLGRRYVGVAERKTPLSVDYASPTVLSARISLPTGAEVALPPEAKATGFGDFEQSTVRDGAALSLKARFAMPRVRIEPERYREFVDFATRVDRAEARAAEIATPPR
jgi:cellulose synthase operon protein C